MSAVTATVKTDSYMFSLLPFITSAKEVMKYPAFVCLFVRLLATSRKNY